MSTRKKVASIAVLIILGVVALPVVNLFTGPPQSTMLQQITLADPEVALASAVLGPKCANCHTDDTKYPFYAAFPVARTLVANDVNTGREFFDLVDVFSVPSGIPSEVNLAKLEYVLENGTMPPARYLVLHWNGGLSSREHEQLLSMIREKRAEYYATASVTATLAQNVLQPIPTKPEEVDARKVALGEKLFTDTRLSQDGTLSCASCHALEKGGTDQEPVATGIGGAKGPINSPTVYNSVFNLAQFWDGRAADLQAQADGPVNNPIEMGSNWEMSTQKLRDDASFQQAFMEVYPEGFSKETITNAIAAYETTLITPDSPFDRFLHGDQTALTAEAQQGYTLFVSSGCAMCHVGKAMGGQSFERMGRYNDYFNERGNLTEVDNGRYNVTKDARDMHTFKVPTLRNVAVTFPYFHDANAKTLEEAVQTMGKYQMNREFTAKETAQLAAFLRSLTGNYQGVPLDAMTTEG